MPPIRSRVPRKRYADTPVSERGRPASNRRWTRASSSAVDDEASFQRAHYSEDTDVGHRGSTACEDGSSISVGLTLAAIRDRAEVS